MLLMILGISGRKQAGKNTTANILHGIVLKEQGFIKDWNIGKRGELLVKDSDGWGEFRVERKDIEFVSWADNNMWPYVKLYSFADSLKTICMDLFDIPFDCLYGSDEEKNKPQQHLLWQNMPTTFPIKHGPMTAREFMQFLGTDVMRKMHEPVWVNSCIKKIQREQSELAIIADVRFPNEAKAIERAGGKVVRLTRKVFDDNHSSEVALDDYPFTDYIEDDNGGIESLIERVKPFYLNLRRGF